MRKMETRVPHSVQQYNNTYIRNSLHDLNTVDHVGTGEIERVNHGELSEDSLDNDDESNSVDCLHDSYRSSLPIHDVGGEKNQHGLGNNGSPRTPNDTTITNDDIMPIENARARFLQIIVDNFIEEHVIEVVDPEVDYNSQSVLQKRKTVDVQYEGDSRFVLPLMYVANLYETLGNDVNIRLGSFIGSREKTIGVALEAAGGLYRMLAKKFPKKGNCTFKRRELATSLETRTRFPELVTQEEEKRVRFVVVNGLAIVEKPSNMPIQDAEWFKKLTGRSEVGVSSRDYKFYSPRHKYRRAGSNSLSNIPELPAFPSTYTSPIVVSTTRFQSVNDQEPASKHHNQSLSHQPQFHPLHQINQQQMHPTEYTPHFSHREQCTSHLPDVPHTRSSSSMSQQHMDCLQPLAGTHVGGRLHILPTGPAKFCDECGAPYLRETSKFCSECGLKRLGM